MHFDFRTDGDGYVITVVGEYDDGVLMPMWERVRAERPDRGFAFGVIDLSDAVVGQIVGWELTQEAAEWLHPIARLIQADIPNGFRVGIVSGQPEMDQAIQDLASVAEFGATASPGSPRADVARHHTLDDALAWCRDGAVQRRSATVRE